MKSLAFVVVLAIAVSSVQAAVVTWSSELLASNGSNVLAEGVEHVGISYGAAGDDSRIINGVNFRVNEAAGNHDNPSWSGWINNRNGSATRYGAAGTDLKELTNDIVYGGTLVLGINNLTVGHTYRIQLISYDASNYWNAQEAAIERWQSITATGGAAFRFQHGTESPYAGIDDVGAALVIGTWTADATEIDFTINGLLGAAGNMNDNAILNGFVVQDVSQVINIAPVQNSHGIALDAELVWQTAGELMDSNFDVYFGDDKNDVAAGDRSVFKGNQTETTYTLEPLQPATTYYWRIDVINGGTLYQGSVWQFSTVPADLPKCLTSLMDMNLDCIVDITDLTLMASQWLDATCLELACADIDGVNGVDLNDFSRLAGDWLRSGSSVVISEFMANNENTLADNFGVFSDWIEIKNLGDTPQDLQGWYLTDDKDRLNKWTFPDVGINAKGHLLVFASGQNLIDDPNYLHTNFQLDSSGEYLALVKPDFSIAYEFNPKYPPQMEDVSYGLTKVIGYDKVVTGYFFSPSPGSNNDIATVNLGPYIDNVVYEPTEPGQADTVVVTARVAPNVGPVDSVFLHYRVMYEAEASVEMYDDGQHGDSSAGDGIYGGAIPAGVADPGEMLRYYVTAADPNGRDNRNPPVLDLGQDRSPEYYGTVIAHPTLTSNLPVLHWFVEDPEAARTDEGTRCSAWFNGDFYDNFTVRRRGFTTADWPKRKFKFDFNTGDHFRLVPGLERVEEINLQSHQYEIGPTSYMREMIAFQFMRDVGVPAPLAYHIQLRQNGAFYGLYSIIEQIDEEFLDRNGFDAAGLMYKATDSHTLGNLRPNPGNDGYRIVIPENATFDALTAVCDGINASNSNRLAYVMDNVNLPQIINEMAAHSTMIHHDRLPKNYYMYRNPKTLEWYRFPWDVEMAFAVGDFLTNTHFNTPLYGDSEHPQSIGSDNYNHLCDAILDLPVTREMFMRRLRTLMDTYLEPSPGGYFETLVSNTKSLIEAEADADNKKWFSGDIDAGVSAILNVSLPARRNQLFTIYGPFGTGYIPGTQVADPKINIGTVEYNPSSYNQDEEYIELINNNPYAVDISGWRIEGGVEFTFQCGTVIPADSRLYVSPNVVVFRARSVTPKGSEGNFVVGNYTGHLSNWGETLTLTDLSSRIVDTVTYTGNPTDQQRYLRITELMYNPLADPNQQHEFIELKNTGPVALDLTGVKFTSGVDLSFEATKTTTTETLVPMTGNWCYNQSNTDLPDQWVTTGYNDSSWPVGAALLYIESSGLPAPKNTLLLMDPIVTCYFRNTFYLDADPVVDGIELELYIIVDDGAVVYINGQEVKRVGMPAGLIGHDTLASSSTSADAELKGPFEIDPGILVAGNNVIAVEVHQDKINSSDIVFGVSLDATITQTTEADRILLDPDEYLVLIRDEAAFESHYGTGINVGGHYAGFLNNGGETIKLEDYTNSTILEFTFNDKWYDITDGGGFSLVINNANDPSFATWDSKSGWRPSGSVNGSPGAEDITTAPIPGSVIINEVLSHTDVAPNDWIELHNITALPINIGGWFLSDSDTDLYKYEIPSGKSIPAYGYIVFTQDDDFGSRFAISENGEQTYLTALTGYSISQSVGASENGIAFGQHIKSNGGSDFVAMSTNTPGTENNAPKVGPVVIREIMYNPSVFGSEDNDEYEYIELHNTSENTINLYEDVSGSNVSWQFTEGVDYTFPPNTTIAPDARLLVVKNINAFRNRYPTVPVGILYGPYEGSLSNGGEKLELSKPGDEKIASSGEYYHIRVEMVNYSDGTHPFESDPWPTEPDGSGASLLRIGNTSYSNDIVNWQAATPTPGE